MTEELIDATGFDYPFIYDAIRWAERDEDFIASLSDEDRIYWGTWDQGHWGMVAVAPGVELPDGFARRRKAMDKDELARTVREGYCKTSYCMAGQRINQSDYRLVFDRSLLLSEEEDSTTFCIQQEQVGKHRNGRPIWKDVEGANRRPIEEVARELMGLRPDETAFFNGDNTVEDLKMYANGMCVRRGIPLMFPDEPVFNFDAERDENY